MYWRGAGNGLTLCCPTLQIRSPACPGFFASVSGLVLYPLAVTLTPGGKQKGLRTLISTLEKILMVGQDYAYASRQAIINSVRSRMSKREVAEAEEKRAVHRAELKRQRAVQYVRGLSVSGV